MVQWPADRREAVWTSILLGLVLLGILAALSVAVPRFVAESRYRTVEVIVDAASVRQVAGQAGMPEDDLLIRLRDLGVTTLAVTERTVEQLVNSGRIALVRPNELSAVADGLGSPWRELVAGYSLPTGRPAVEGSVFVIWQPRDLTAETHQALVNRLQGVSGLQITRDPEVWQISARTPQHPNYLANPAHGVQTLGLGFDGLELAHYTDLGFRLALRPLDSPGFTSADVEHVLADLPLTPDQQSVIIFDGSAVPGQPGAVEAWAHALGTARAPVAWIEFAVQRDLDRLIRQLDYVAVRLHSIAGPELHGLQPDEALARWMRAVTERSVRALYVRLYTEPPKGTSLSDATDLVNLNLDYTQRLIHRLQGRGYQLGAAEPIRLPALGLVPRLLLFLSVAAASLLLLQSFIKLPIAAEALMGLGMTALLTLSDGLLGRQVAAFAAAVVFPTLATVWVVRHLQGRANVNPWLASTAGLLAATTISLVGALHVVGLLSETPFAIGLNLFMGVKAMHVVPPLLVGAALLWQQPVRTLRQAVAKVVGLVRLPIPLGYVLALGLVSALALIVVLRTGTDLLPVPGLERWFRTALEESLGVRPRNKEFLLGHPLFVVTCLLVIRRRLPALLVPICAAVASIGQLSLINTFAHIHAPLATSLLRTLHGVELGGVLGLGASWILWTGLRSQRRDGDAP